MPDSRADSDVAKNKAVARQFLDEVHNQGRLEAIDVHLHPEVFSHDSFPGQAPGAKGVRDTMNLFKAAFPDKKIVFNEILGEGDKVMVKVTVTGTHRGEFMGMPPSGNAISFEEVIIFRFENEKIVEHWSVADALSLLQQVGAVKL